MKLNVTRVDVWVSDLKDKPGGLAAKLAPLVDAGTNLGFIIARREQKKAGTGAVFVAGPKGAGQLRAAKKAGFRKTKSLHAVRVDGADKPGIAARVAQELGDGGINLRGLSGAVVGKRFAVHVAFDTAADATKAIRLVKRIA